MRKRDRSSIKILATLKMRSIMSFQRRYNIMHNDRQYLCDCAVIAILCAIM